MKLRTLNSMTAILAAVSTMALASCDRLPLARSSDKQAQAEVTAPTEVVDVPDKLSKLEWVWSEATGTLWSFGTSQPEVYWPLGGGLGIRTPVESTDLDVFLRSPRIDVEGNVFSKIVVDLECVNPGQQADLAIYYIANSHSESPDFRATPLESSPLQVGERRKLVYDMTRLARGESDWVESNIQRIRFDLPQGAGADYILHSIQLCEPDDPNCV